MQQRTKSQISLIWVNFYILAKDVDDIIVFGNLGKDELLTHQFLPDFCWHLIDGAKCPLHQGQTVTYSAEVQLESPEIFDSLATQPLDFHFIVYIVHIEDFERIPLFHIKQSIMLEQVQPRKIDDN